jgi:hypothetical protein
MEAKNKITEEIIDRLVFEEGGDGVEHEIWIDPTTDKLYVVPIEIKRYFKQAREY